MTLFQSGTTALVPFIVNVSSASATDVVDGTSSGDDQSIIVPRLSVNHHSDTAINLTVDLYDGTNTRYLGAMGSTWNAKALSNKMCVLFEDIVVPKGWKLRVTSSSASGLLHIVGVRVRPN